MPVAGRKPGRFLGALVIDGARALGAKAIAGEMVRADFAEGGARMFARGWGARVKSVRGQELLSAMPAVVELAGFPKCYKQIMMLGPRS